MIGEIGLKINVPLTGTILFLGGSWRDTTLDFVIVIVRLFVLDPGRERTSFALRSPVKQAGNLDETCML